MHTTTPSLRPRAGCRRRVRRAAGRVCLALAVLLAFSGGARGAAAVDANTATREELQTIKGIGPAMSGRIIAERERGGPFRSPQDLDVRVKGIGEATLRRMRDSGLVVGRSVPGRDARQGRVEERSPPGASRGPARP